MKNKNQRIIEKFIKKDNFCNICQQPRKLSEDHVPPQACPPAKSRVISKLLYEIVGDRSFRPRFSQNGVYYKTICSECNNGLGSKYDLALGEFSKKVESFVESSIALPDSFEIECCPNAILRSVLGHLLAAKTETDEIVIDSLIRPSILNETVPIHDDIHVFYWIYPYEKTIILRDFLMPAIRGMLDTKGHFNMIKFYPIAFLITYQLPTYEGLSSLHKFNSIPVNDKACVTINLQAAKSSTWPEECLETEHFLLFGRAIKDSVYSVPRIQRIKV
jgi:hypothetical protein